MDGIYEEPPLAEISRLALLDPVASAELGQDVVYAVQTGRHLIDQQECDCLTASDYTSDLPRSAAMLSYAAALSIIIVALASAASLLILASGWTL